MLTKTLDSVPNSVARFLGSTVRRVEVDLNRLCPFLKTAPAVKRTVSVPAAVPKHVPQVYAAPKPMVIQQPVSAPHTVVRPTPPKTENMLKGMAFANKIEEVKGEIFYNDILSPSRMIRIKAIEHIKDLAPETAVAILDKILRSETDILKVTELINALASLGTSKGVPKHIFRAYCDHQDAGIRQAAIRAISKYRDEESFGILTSHMKDKDPEVRRQALNCLCWEYGSRCEPYALTALHDLNAHVRRTACQIAGALKIKQAISALISLLSDTDLKVQDSAAASLKKITKQDFHFKAKSSQKDKEASIEDWKFWWRDNQTKYARETNARN